MATDVFPPAGVELGTPDWGFKESPEADVDVIPLGDGYESREPKGLNWIKDSYEPTWSSLETAPAQQAYEFLRARLKLKAVMWNHPVTGQPVKVVPQAVSINYDTYNNAILSVTFKRDHNPG